MLEALMFALLGPPLLGKGASIIDDRIGPALVVIEYLAAFDDEQIRGLQAAFNFHGWKLANYVPAKKIEGQRALPVDLPIGGGGPMERAAWVLV